MKQKRHLFKYFCPALASFSDAQKKNGVVAYTAVSIAASLPAIIVEEQFIFLLVTKQWEEKTYQPFGISPNWKPAIVIDLQLNHEQKQTVCFN